MPYRQLEGFTRDLNRLLPRLPPADYSGLRRRVLEVDLSPYESLGVVRQNHVRSLLTGYVWREMEREYKKRNGVWGLIFNAHTIILNIECCIERIFIAEYANSFY